MNDSITQPLVSILAMSYKEDEKLRNECIDSILSQTYGNIELIISNDGAEEFDESTVISYIKSKKPANITSIIVNKNPQNLGTVKNCNTALDLSSGDYLMFMACDDIYNNKNVITDMVNGFNIVPPDVMCIVAQAGMYNSDLSQCEHLFVSEETQKFINELTPQEFYRNHLVLRALLPAVSAIYKRETFDVYGKFDERFFLIEDYTFHIHSTKRGMRYYYLDIMCVNHRDGGISHSLLNPESYASTRYMQDDVAILKEILTDTTLDKKVWESVKWKHDYHAQLYYNVFESYHRLKKRPTPTLSIIMPCYNVASTLPRALDSILMQQADFSYEILIVDDRSSDGTTAVVKEYAKKHDNIFLIYHQVNTGNAGAFYSGLCAAKGEFFCVLDGDDYYTHREKLQRQINFFKSDFNHEYVASAHHYLFDLGDGDLTIDRRLDISEFNYSDILAQDKYEVGYYHTSTYMFRHIFKDNVPECLRNDGFRGDSPRVALHLQASRKKIKILDFVGSSYVYTYDGLWSGITKKKQMDRHLLLLESLKSISDTRYEIEYYNRQISHTHERGDFSEKFHSFLAGDADCYLNQLRDYTGMLSFRHDDFMFKALYFSQYIDSLCASIGYINRLYSPECVQKTCNDNRIAIIIGLLTPQGGGIFKEITELAEMYSDKEILLLLTNIADSDVSPDVHKVFAGYPHVSVRAVPAHEKSKLWWLGREMANFAPFKAYYYTSHNDPYAQALMQSGVCKNVCLFSFDHGYICGISNPNLDCIIAKRPADFELLHKHFGSKVIYIPTWGTKPKDCEECKYTPFNQHSNLVTACGAARFYKLEGKSSSSYLNTVLSLLSITKGQHIHYGPIPNNERDFIQNYLTENNLPQSSFLHIEWVDNMALDMLKRNVDIFIEPFPVVSYKITLEVLSVGIPIISRDIQNRLGHNDFIYSGNLLWNTRQDFMDTMTSLTKEILSEHSEKSLNYFNENHDAEVIKPYIRNEQQFQKARNVTTIDSGLTEIRQYEKMYGRDGELVLSGNKNKMRDVVVYPPTSVATPQSSVETESSIHRREDSQEFTQRCNGMMFYIKSTPRYIKKIVSSIKENGLASTAKFILKKVREKLD